MQVASEQDGVVGPKRPKRMAAGMGLFTIVWMGQVVSSFGSTLSSFALGVRVFQDTGSVTRFALIALAMVLPNLVLSPLAGVVADRWDRRMVLIFSHAGSALCTMALLRLVVTDRIVAWHVYPVVAASAVFATFIWPTFSAATTLMVGKAHLGRAAGMNEFGMALAQVVAPISAAGLLVAVGLRGLILIDFATFTFAIVVLLFVRFPQPPKGVPIVAPGAGLKAQMLVGWSYIRARPALWGLLLLAAGHKFSVALVQTLLTPLVLGFASPAMLGLVLGAASGGMLVGGIAVSVWGGPQRRVPAILTVMVVQGLLLMLAGLRPNVTLIACTAFLFLLFLPIVIASNQAIWQSKVAPEIQGRVFATRRMVAGSMMPIALAFAGPVADLIEPMLAPGGVLASTVGGVIGVGPGRGMGFLLMLTGGGLLLMAVLGARSSQIRTVEIDLPDAEGVPDSIDGPDVSRAGRTVPALTGRPLPRGVGVVVGAALVGLAVLAIGLQRPPKALDEAAPSDAFAAARAQRHIEVLARHPRPLGAPAHADARRYIAERLADMGLEVVEQADTSVQPGRGVTQMVAVTNVIGRLRGTGHGSNGSEMGGPEAVGAILLVAHYDTVYGSPGANDDAAGVAVLLETARALRAGPPLVRDVLFLFSDGEETGLHGVRVFSAWHEWARDVAVVLNFEARGRGGVVYMFQTGPDNGGWIPGFLAGSPAPVANSLMNQIYQRLPNDTDLSVFLEAGVAGFNFAHIEGLTHYHSALDRPETVDPNSVQHHGSYALGLTRHFGDQSAMPRAQPDRTYFNVLGTRAISYPRSVAWALALAALLATALVVRKGLRRNQLTVFGLAQGSLAFLGMVVVVPVGATLIWLVARDIAGVAILRGSTAGASLFMLAFVCLAVGATVALYRLCRRLIAADDLAAGALVLWSVLVVATCGLALPTDTNFLFAWPLLAAALGLGALMRAPTGPASPWVRVAVLVGMAVPGLLLIAPFTGALYTGLQGLVQLGGLALVPAMLLLGLLFPHFEGMSARVVSVGASVASIGLLGLALWGPAQAERVVANSVLYAQDESDLESSPAHWFSFDTETDGWTRAFGFEEGRRGSLARFFPLPWRDVLHADAPSAGLPTPGIEVIASHRDGAVTTHHVRVHDGAVPDGAVPDGAVPDSQDPDLVGDPDLERGLERVVDGSRARLLWIAPAEAVISASLDGHRLVLDETGRLGAAVALQVPAVATSTLIVETRADADVELVVVEQRAGLPMPPDVGPRGPEFVPLPLFTFLESDVSLVRSSMTLRGVP